MSESHLKGASGDAERQRLTAEGRNEQRTNLLAMAAFYERAGDAERAGECRDAAGEIV